ncbi:MAG: hypothetical protein MUF73_13085 [Rhodobacteraceae bacterium]|nr:hypothetical protein [Paracoccaceae bacterium]
MAAAVARALALWAVAAGTLWLHALAGVPGSYLGQGYPVHPGLRVTLPNLALDAGMATLPVGLFGLATRALVARRPGWATPLRTAALPVVVLLWIWAAEMTIFAFTIDFGTTWTRFAPFRALVLHPLHTPLALGVLLAATWVLLAPRRRD